MIDDCYNTKDVAIKSSRSPACPRRAAGVSLEAEPDIVDAVALSEAQQCGQTLERDRLYEVA
jgi:hypothetical protein